MRTAGLIRTRTESRGDELPLPGDDVVQGPASQAPFHVRWGGIGYAVGLMLIVPFVLWMAEVPADKVRAPMFPVPVKAGAEAPIQLTGPMPGSRDVMPQTGDGAVLPAATNLDRERLEAAAILIKSHAIEQARIKLKPLVEAGNGEALFLLAGTFDPVQLAALGVSGVRAEAERARHLYEQALAAGFVAARGRLDQLQ